MGDMVQCRLCKRLFPITEMSEEHYPARCVGNTDIVGVDIIKLVDALAPKMRTSEKCGKIRPTQKEAAKDGTQE